MSTLILVDRVILSAQVSESICLDLSLFPFIQLSLNRHRSGDLGDVYGSDLMSGIYSYLNGGRVCSVYPIDDIQSLLYSCEISIITPADRTATIISFLGEL